jgi:hypothetical protein
MNFSSFFFILFFRLICHSSSLRLFSSFICFVMSLRSRPDSSLFSSVSSGSDVDPLDSPSQDRLISELWSTKFQQDQMWRYGLILICFLLHLPLYHGFHRFQCSSDFVRYLLYFFHLLLIFVYFITGFTLVRSRRCLSTNENSPFTRFYYYISDQISFRHLLLFLFILQFFALLFACFSSFYVPSLPSSDLLHSFSLHSSASFSSFLSSSYFPSVLTSLYFLFVFYSVQESQNMEKEVVTLEKMKYQLHSA